MNYLEEKGISLVGDKKEYIKNKLLLKWPQKFKTERHNLFIEEIRKIALSSNDDKKMKSTDSMETYPHWMSKDIIWKKEKN